MKPKGDEAPLPLFKKLDLTQQEAARPGTAIKVVATDGHAVFGMLVEEMFVGRSFDAISCQKSTSEHLLQLLMNVTVFRLDGGLCCAVNMVPLDRQQISLTPRLQRA